MLTRRGASKLQDSHRKQSKVVKKLPGEPRINSCCNDPIQEIQTHRGLTTVESSQCLTRGGINSYGSNEVEIDLKSVGKIVEESSQSTVIVSHEALDRSDMQDAVDESGDDDDGLPNISLSVTSHEPLKAGDLCWVRWRKEPFWPALILRTSKWHGTLKRLRIVFIEYNGPTADEKCDLGMTLKSRPFSLSYSNKKILPITTDDCRKHVDAGMRSANHKAFAKSWSLVEEWLMKQALVKDLLSDVQTFFGVNLIQRPTKLVNLESGGPCTSDITRTSNLPKHHNITDEDSDSCSVSSYEQGLSKISEDEDTDRASTISSYKDSDREESEDDQRRHKKNDERAMLLVNYIESAKGRERIRWLSLRQRISGLYVDHSKKKMSKTYIINRHFVQRRLSAIKSGRSKSCFELEYRRPKNTNDQMKQNSIGFGPVTNEDQVERIFRAVQDCCRKLQSSEPVDSLFTIDTVDRRHMYEVDLPEAIVCSLMTVRRKTRAEAEKIFYNGVE